MTTNEELIAQARRIEAMGESLGDELSGIWLFARNARIALEAAQVVPQPGREALADEEAVFEYFALNNLYVLPVLAADGEPYLIGTSEDGEMFAQGLPLEDDMGATDMNNGHLEDKPEEWWPLVPLMPVAALSPAPLTINREALRSVIAARMPGVTIEADTDTITDAVLAALSTQPAAGEVEWEYGALTPDKLGMDVMVDDGTVPVLSPPEQIYRRRKAGPWEKAQS